MWSKKFIKKKNVGIAFSGIFHGEDRYCMDMIDDSKKNLKSYYASTVLGFISNVNIDPPGVKKQITFELQRL